MKIKNKLILIVAFAAFLSIEALSLADTCPVPSTSVTANVTSSVSFDSHTGLYVYNYKLENDRSSQLPIKRFLILTPVGPQSTKTPEKWHSTYSSGGGSAPPRVSWSTTALDPSFKNPTAPGYNGPMPASFYAVKPGASLIGFTYESASPPGPTSFMIEGDTAVPSTVGTAENDEPQPNCPGWNFTGSKYKNMVTGITQGPVAAGTAAAQIRLRDANGELPYNTFDPNHPQGKMNVLILSNTSFDATTVDPKSIQFGPGNASPLSYKLVDTLHKRWVPEMEDWEKFTFSLLDLKGEYIPRTPAKDLLLLFDVKSIGVRCILDHALFLSGKTKDGKAIVGGKAIQLEGCSKSVSH